MHRSRFLSGSGALPITLDGPPARGARAPPGAWASAPAVGCAAPGRGKLARRASRSARRRIACAARRRRRPTGGAPPTPRRGPPLPPATPGSPAAVLRLYQPRLLPRARRLLAPQIPVLRQHLPRRVWGASSGLALEALGPELRRSLPRRVRGFKRAPPFGRGRRFAIPWLGRAPLAA